MDPGATGEESISTWETSHFLEYTVFRFAWSANAGVPLGLRLLRNCFFLFPKLSLSWLQLYMWTKACGRRFLFIQVMFTYMK